MSVLVQVFGRRHEEAIHALRRPASEKRQCTKSRECGTRQCSECYGDRMLVANHCAIDRSIGVRWHGADQFLARRNIHGTFKETWFALFVKTTLSLRDGGVDVTRRIRVPACQMILAVLDHALHADNT
jgi:hypothetical protein